MCDYSKVIVTDDCKGFVFVNSVALVADIVLADETAVLVPHWELVLISGFDAVAAYVVDVLDSRVVVAFHVAVYLVVVVVFTLLVGLEFMFMLLFWFFLFLTRF